MGLVFSRRHLQTILGLALLTVGGLAISVMTLSDRLPQIAEHRLGQLDPRLEQLVDPIMDAGHLAVWAVMAFVTMVMLRQWWLQILALGGMAVIATGLEYAQAHFSSTRNMSAQDAKANLMGLALGAAIGLLVTTGVRAVRLSRTP